MSLRTNQECFYTTLHNVSRYDIICCLANPESVPGDAESILVKFFRSFYAPALLNKYVRPLVIVSFFVVFCEWTKWINWKNYLVQIIFPSKLLLI